VQVQVTVRNGTLDLHLQSASDSGRAALLEALPALRADLQGAGLTCSRLDVSRDALTQQQTTQQQTAGQQGRPGSQQRGDGRPAPWPATPDRGEGRPAPTSTSSASTGVDVRV